MSFEQWRPIPGYPRYEASSMGRVRSAAYVDGKGHWRKPKNISLKRSDRGHWTVCLTKEAGARQQRVPLGRIVLEAFGLCPLPGEIVLHGPKGRDCNELSNLSFGTHFQNNGEDRRRDGTDLAGCSHPRTHLSEDNVRSIRELRGRMTQEEIGKRFGIDQTTVSSIQRRKSFKEIE